VLATPNSKSKEGFALLPMSDKRINDGNAVCHDQLQSESLSLYMLAR
jgi:hypothetical protein